MSIFLQYKLKIELKKAAHSDFYLERITGLEPATSTLARSRSTKWAKSAYGILKAKDISYTQVTRYGGATRNRTGDKGFADLCLTAWLWRHLKKFIKKRNSEQATVHYSDITEWSGLRGSNPPPRPWQGRTLPNELNPHKANRLCFIHSENKMVPPVGIEPTTRGFSVPCSTDWATEANNKQ